MEFLADAGPAGLFVAAFLAATILPLSSEIVLGALLLGGQSPLVLVPVATAGNVLGSLVNYGLGYRASVGLVKKWPGLSGDEFLRAERRVARYGKYTLLFAWVPFIGDPLTVAAGALRVPLTWFVVLVTAGKLARYVAISYVTLQID